MRRGESSSVGSCRDRMSRGDRSLVMKSEKWRGEDFPLAAPMTYAGSREQYQLIAPHMDSTSSSFSPGMSGPRPSTRTFLCDLSCFPADSKVRFLGWYVQSSDSESSPPLAHAAIAVILYYTCSATSASYQN